MTQRESRQQRAKSAPGDLGRRVAHLRERLGLTREQVAERAGMAPGFVGYLEERTATLDEGSLLRLAAALETTCEELLGGEVERPPGRGRPPAHPAMEPLDADECLRLISPGGIGRVAFAGPGGPTVLPVNYLLQGGVIVFRTQAGGPIDQDLRTGVRGVEIEIAFEVDRIDDARRGGWSVLIRGPAHHMAPEELPEVAGAAVHPWAGGPREIYVRVVPRQITGRRIEGF
ncbi:hypothetical protein Sme01_69750 [Sphaerisporangium melleum]|uniref:HTH cro/C1-type domain-containing protein n=1 Tax=Sphaerisporangium melleum TaxID=321316 RepID=A0A917RKX0_9ACTN|nr:pyridoxamine 5'-phosphate oxidase family protein [Sphaerisporangium melleum]GGL13445.1 hypothetical protein GCM10007964_64410 [Sphaerisporangium melleum]GII74499.1 hypothetical protein Sme01_69750 [Sphaerisporangium melleum]